MIARIYPPGTGAVTPFKIRLPLSKSVSIRRLLLDSLAGVSTPGDDVSDCGDTRAVRRALALSGSVCRIDVGASGAAMRFLTAFAACNDGRITLLSGIPRLCERPIAPLVDALRTLGAGIAYTGIEEYPPLKISGRRLHGGNVSLSGSISSQHVSALMLIAPTLPKGLCINVRPPVVSKPYIAMTGRMIGRYGARCHMLETSDGSLSIEIGPSILSAPAEGIKEPDWTAASYWMEVSALTRRNVVFPVTVSESLQGDASASEYFSMINSAQGSGGPLRLDLVDTPDIAQTLAATCCGLGVPFRFSGLANLKIKETDRLTALCSELAKLGFDAGQDDGGAISWNGERRRCDGKVRIATYGDHRMAMAMAPLAVLSPGLEIEDPDVVAKSYPDFWTDLRSAGFEVNFEE